MYGERTAPRRSSLQSQSPLAVKEKHSRIAASRTAINTHRAPARKKGVR